MNRSLQLGLLTSRRVLRGILLGAGAILGFACSTSGGDASTARVADANADAGAGGESGRPEPTCPAEEAASGTCVHYVEGTVTDLSGEPVGPTSVTVCGPGTCYGDRGDGAGRFKVRVGAYLDLSAYLVHLDGRPAHADRFVSLEGLTGPTLTLATPIRTVRLPASGPLLVSNGPGATLRSEAVTVRMEAGTELDFGFANLADEAHGQELRAALVPPGSSAEWSDYLVVAALAPFGTAASKPLSIRIDLTTALTPGEAVEFLVLQDDYASPDLGQMVVQATGHVSDDGLHVDTDEGQGIHRLTWIAVRPSGKGK